MFRKAAPTGARALARREQAAEPVAWPIFCTPIGASKTWDSGTVGPPGCSRH